MNTYKRRKSLKKESFKYEEDSEINRRGKVGY